MHKSCLLFLLLWTGCGAAGSGPGPGGGVIAPKTLPCAGGTAAVAMLDSRAAICAGFPSCNDNGWALCQGISSEALEACQKRPGTYLGAPGKRPSGADPQYGCPPNPSPDAINNITFWRACGIPSDKLKVSNWETLTWGCGDFLNSVDCQWLDAPRCAALPASIPASSVCCPK